MIDLPPESTVGDKPQGIWICGFKKKLVNLSMSTCLEVNQLNCVDVFSLSLKPAATKTKVD